MGTKRLFRNSATGAVRRSDSTALSFHRSWPGYRPTRLVEAPPIAAELGVATVLVKDESQRLGMPSFKILGASWASHRALCQHLGVDHVEVAGLDDLRQLLGVQAPLTLVAATDGNHGRAVARMALLLGLSSHILVPADMAPARIRAIQDERAKVTVVNGGYDDAVRASAALADDEHLVISDTSWPGYDQVPRWVIDGYSTIGQEVDEQVAQAGHPVPTVVAAQIGVGAFATALVRHFKDDRTRIVGVEPTRADCLIASLEAGQPVEIPGPQDSIMAGLNCGMPSLVAWPELAAGVDVCVAIEDEAAEVAMRTLAGVGVESGESGAAGLAGLLAFRNELQLSPDDCVLVVSTEGATDPEAYERILGRTATANH